MNTITILFLASCMLLGSADVRVRRQIGAFPNGGAAPIPGGFGGIGPGFNNPSAYYQPAGFPAAGQQQLNGGGQIGLGVGNNFGYSGLSAGAPRVYNNGAYTGIHNRPYPSTNAGYPYDNGANYLAAPGASFLGGQAGSHNGALLNYQQPYVGAYEGQGGNFASQRVGQHYQPQIPSYSTGSERYTAGNSIPHAGTDEALIPRGGSEQSYNSNGPIYAGGNVYPSGSNVAYNNRGGNEGSAYGSENYPSYSTSSGSQEPPPYSGEGSDDEGDSYNNYPSNNDANSNTYTYSGNRNLAGA